MSYRTDNDAALLEAARRHILAVWPGFKGNFAEAMDLLTRSHVASGMSPGVRAAYDRARAELEAPYVARPA